MKLCEYMNNLFNMTELYKSIDGSKIKIKKWMFGMNNIFVFDPNYYSLHLMFPYEKDGEVDFWFVVMEFRDISIGKVSLIGVIDIEWR